MPFDCTDYQGWGGGNKPRFDPSVKAELPWILGALVLAATVGDYVAWTVAGMPPPRPIPAPGSPGEAPSILEVLGFMLPFFGILGAFIWWRAHQIAAQFE